MRYELKHLRSPVYDLIKILACLLVAFEIRLYSRLILGLLTRTFTDVSLFKYLPIEPLYFHWPRELLRFFPFIFNLWSVHKLRSVKK